ncbi:uracil-DNA glycosylase [Nitratifractor sp.]|uniref:uracil-DNA glycosylase n=1 Tax=Nitratifractor sp. TaxID=2268144 RepID=UPI0025E80759|nr:uracil-DNA glycosylase [Nitratifractor sp.]
MKDLLRLNGVDTVWDPILVPALEALEEEYREWLLEGEGYIPAKNRLLAAFSTLQPEDLRYILFGQDPYPREESAIGYAFIDGRVDKIFSEKGLSKEVNRATSLRNFIKMTLVADGRLDPAETSQAAIAALDKNDLIDTMQELRHNFETAGVLLLNMALVFSGSEASHRHIRAWRGFVETLLEGLRKEAPTLILFGAHAREVERLSAAEGLPRIALEHPYNHSFITNPEAHALFGPMKLLRRVWEEN